MARRKVGQRKTSQIKDPLTGKFVRKEDTVMVPIVYPPAYDYKRSAESLKQKHEDKMRLAEERKQKQQSHSTSQQTAFAPHRIETPSRPKGPIPRLIHPMERFDKRRSNFYSNAELFFRIQVRHNKELQEKVVTSFNEVKEEVQRLQIHTGQISFDLSELKENSSQTRDGINQISLNSQATKHYIELGNVTRSQENRLLYDAVSLGTKYQFDVYASIEKMRKERRDFNRTDGPSKTSFFRPSTNKRGGKKGFGMDFGSKAFLGTLALGAATVFFDKIKDKFGEFGEFMTKQVIRFAKAIPGMIFSTGKLLFNTIKGAISLIPRALDSLGGSIIDFFKDPIGMIKKGGKFLTKAFEGAMAVAKGGVAGVKSVFKTVGKAGAKRFPVLGPVAGVGFGALDIMDGDYVGAGLNVASGFSSLLDFVAPGLGVSTGLGIDAYNLAREYKGGGQRKRPQGGLVSNKLSGFNIKQSKEEPVDIRGLQPEITSKAPDIINAFQSIAPGYMPTITSGLDGSHSLKSKHYEGKAIDLRTKDLPKGAARKITNKLKSSLGSNYDVLLEDIGNANEHIHIEYDPKRNTLPSLPNIVSSKPFGGLNMGSMSTSGVLKNKPQGDSPILVNTDKRDKKDQEEFWLNRFMDQFMDRFDKLLDKHGKNDSALRVGSNSVAASTR